MQLLQEGDIRFIIADRATTDIDETQFIKRVRDAQTSLLYLHRIDHTQGPGNRHHHPAHGRGRLPAQADRPHRNQITRPYRRTHSWSWETISNKPRDTLEHTGDVRSAHEPGEPESFPGIIERRT